MDHRIKRTAQTFAALLVGLAGVFFLAIWSENSNRMAHIERLDVSLRQSAQAIGQHVTDSIEMAELAIVALESEIRRSRSRGDLPNQLGLFIAHLTDHTPNLSNLLYIDERGILVASSARAFSLMDNEPHFRDRQYFLHHQSNDTQETFIGAPIVSRLTGEVVVPITRRLESADGAFAGVVAADLPMSDLMKTMESLTLTQGASLLLGRSDGTKLSHWPNDPLLATVRNLRDPPLSEIIEASRQTVSTANWPTDGLSRHNAAFENEHPGLIVLIGAPETQVLWDWVEGARTRWILSAGLFLLAIVLILRWHHQTILNIRNRSMLQRREAEFELLAEASADVIERLTPEGVREYVSPSARQVLGFAPDQLIGTSLFDTLPAEEHAVAKASLARLQQGASLQRALTCHKHPEGREVWLETTLSRISSKRGGPSAIVAITRDVTSQKHRQDELNTLASTDALTGLSNRRCFDLRLEELVVEAHQMSKTFSLLIIDVDRFKLYNDTYGHAGGDVCLKAIAKAIEQSVRRTDLAVRYGGEEFAVLLPTADEAGAKLVAEKIRQKVASLKLPHERNQPYGVTTISIGVAGWNLQSPPATGGNGLFSLADAALYEAKNTGRNRVILSSATEETARIGTVISA